MRKYFIFIVIFLFILAAGCARKNTSTNNNKADTANLGKFTDEIEGLICKTDPKAPAITGLTAKVEDGKVYLEWKPCETGCSIRVYRKVEGETQYSPNGVLIGGKKTYDTKVEKGKTYTYAIQVCYTDKNQPDLYGLQSDYSEPVTITVE